VNDLAPLAPLPSSNLGCQPSLQQPPPKPSRVSRARADPTGAASHKRCSRLSSCGKCSKICLRALWELSSLQPDCICAALTPTQTTFCSFSDTRYSDWDPTPAVPGDSQQESPFLPPVSTQKFWKARPEQFQRPRTKNTFMRASPQVPLGTWWDARLCHCSAEERGTLPRIAGCQDTQRQGGKTSHNKGDGHRTCGEHTSPQEHCSFRTGLERWWDASPWRYSTPAWTGAEQPLPAPELALLGAGAGWEAPGILPTPPP